MANIDHSVYQPIAEFVTELFRATGGKHVQKIVLSGHLASSLGSAPGEVVELLTPTGTVRVEFTHG